MNSTDNDKTSNSKKMIVKNKNMKNMNKFYLVFTLFIFVLILASLSSISVRALGVAPGEQVVIFDGKDIQYDLRIVNDDKKDATYTFEVNGELSQYVSLSKTSVAFTTDKTEDTITLKLSIPQTAKASPGEYTIRLVIKGEKKNSTGVVAFVGVISKLIVTIPGDEAFIKVNTFIPNFVNGEQNSFSADITNTGVKPATNCFAVIEVYNALSEKIDSLTSNKITVMGARTERLLLPWKPTLSNGRYLAKTSIICDGISAEDEKPFSIGSPDVRVVDFVADSFVLGQINKFDLVLGSEWGEKIDPIYADIEVTKNNVPISQAKTESTSIAPMKKVSLPVYLDTKSMAPGEYSMYIMLHYLNKNVGEAYTIHVSSNEIVIDRLSGMVTGGDATKTDTAGSGGTNTLLIIAIVILLIFIIVLLVKLLKKKEK